MQQRQWTSSTIKQFEAASGLRLLYDKSSLDHYNHDFGGLYRGQAFAVFKPRTLDEIQHFLRFAHHHQLAYTIRCHGMSQSGQSLACSGDVVLDVSLLNLRCSWQGDTLAVGCSVTWRRLLENALSHHQLPPVFPYNTRLSVGGILSAGGLGSASPRWGTCASYVRSLLVLTVDGLLQRCSPRENQRLFEAVLSGVGQFAVLYEAELELVSAASQLQLHKLYFSDHQHWIDAQYTLKDNVDYLEAYCQFTHPTEGTVFEAPRYCLSIAVDAENSAHIPSLIASVVPADYEAVQTLDMIDYILRHEPRISQMMAKPYCDFYHPWFECYIPRTVLYQHLGAWIASYPRALGPLLHCFPVAAKHSRFFQMPEDSETMTLNILSPGVPAEHLKDCQQWLLALDDFLRQNGGKRYLSGWIPQAGNSKYWQQHFDQDWQAWQDRKVSLDPNGVLRSQMLHADHGKVEET
ncbi:MAG: FAD-binding oxidoreductase [Legionellaceae bacterium]|nr:FAD-binding oxidoreductase [Legionellaceae bacterium]